MGKVTAISWCDHTMNPWWGCNQVSPGCDNCYAKTLAERYGYKDPVPTAADPNPVPKRPEGAIWGAPAVTSRRLFGDGHWAEPLKWNAEARTEGRRRRVFCGSMCDIFEFDPVADRLDAERMKLWYLIARTDWLDWLLLTKRPEQIMRMVPGSWRFRFPDNVWVGTSAEDQERADQRIPILLQVPARVRFVSAEPLLGPLEFSDVTRRADAAALLGRPALEGIHWVIVGGESGSGQPDRKMVELDSDRVWAPTDRGLAMARSIRDQCAAAGTAFFFKQWGGPVHGSAGDRLDGRQWQEFPATAWPIDREVRTVAKIEASIADVLGV